MLWPLLLLVSVPERPFPDERLLLDRRLEALRRILPDGPIAVADAALGRDMAEQARLAAVESLARPPVESGARGHVAVELTAVGSYAQVDRFFGLVALSHRLVDVFAVGDRVMVLKRGENVGDRYIETTDEHEVLEIIVSGTRERALAADEARG